MNLHGSIEKIAHIINTTEKASTLPTKIKAKNLILNEELTLFERIYRKIKNSFNENVDSKLLHVVEKRTLKHLNFLRDRNFLEPTQCEIIFKN